MRTLFRFIAAIITRLLGIDEESEKADMHLSTRALGLALSAFLAFFILAARYISTKEWFYLVLGAGFLFIFAGILLCYKNQRIYIISDEEFIYSTMFGRKSTYKFRDVKLLRKNRDSMTLFVHDGQLHKIHIESSATMSQRLIDLINKALVETREQ